MITQEVKTEVVKTHYQVVQQILGDEKAVDFIAWTTRFFAENPQILKDISNPQTREKVFSAATSLMNNPLLKSLF